MSTLPSPHPAPPFPTPPRAAKGCVAGPRIGLCHRAPRAPLVLSLLLVLLGLAGVPRTGAHQASDAFLSLTLTNKLMVGRLDLAIQDLHALIDLDDDVDGLINWGEMKAHEAEAAAYIRTNFLLSINGQPASLGPLELQVDERSDGAFAVWTFSLAAGSKPRHIEMTYRCLFEVDALHRAFVKLDADGILMTAMLSPSQLTHRFELESPAGDATPASSGFFREGIWHIWTGYDHVLFLLALLLPAVLAWREERWQALEDLRPAVLTVLKTVTAFTLAHSVTLSLAALDLIRLPGRWVEPMIAVSVVLAAANNLKPFLSQRGWTVALVFGLLHGFGFAGVLQEMDLKGAALAWPLVAFNLGVETGQTVMVLVFMPLAFALRHTPVYLIGAVRYGSIAICMLATVWFFERVLGS